MLLLEPSDECQSGAVPAERAASESLVEGAAGAHLERPRLINPEGGFRSRMTSGPELRAEIIPLRTEGERQAETSVLGQLQVRRGRHRVELVQPGIVVTVVVVGGRAELRYGETEIE